MFQQPDDALLKLKERCAIHGPVHRRT